MTSRGLGNRDTFDIELVWVEASSDEWPDLEERACVADISIWVGGELVSAHTEGGESVPLRWTALTLVEWLLREWDPLLHEQRLPLNLGVSHAAEVLRAASSPPPGLTPTEEFTWAEGRDSWRSRHCLAAIDDGGLWPDLYIRRVFDTVEISLTTDRVPFAPQWWDFDREAPVARLPFRHVQEIFDAAIGAVLGRLEDVESPRVERLRSAAHDLGHSSLARTRAREAWQYGQVLEIPEALQSSDAEVVAVLPMRPLAMLFASAPADLSESDLFTLSKLISTSPEGSSLLDDVTLTYQDIVGQHAGRQGSALGEQAWQILCGPTAERPVPIEKVLTDSGLQVRDVDLDSEAVRGVSIWLRGHAPSIAINANHAFHHGPAKRDAVRRFTLAHELAHLLLDREVALDLAIVSSEAGPVDLEKRANAFAASFLLPEELLRPVAPHIADLATLDGTRAMANQFGVSRSVLVERLHNLGWISRERADDLREVD